MKLIEINCNNYTCVGCNGRGCSKCKQTGFFNAPVSINQIYSGGRNTYRRFMTVKGKSWKEHIKESVFFEVFHGKNCYKSEPTHFELWLEWGFPDKRKRDQDNYIKPVKDALSGIIWADDNQVYIEHSKKAVTGKWSLIVKWRVV